MNFNKKTKYICCQPKNLHNVIHKVALIVLKNNDFYVNCLKWYVFSCYSFCKLDELLVDVEVDKRLKWNSFK